MSVSRPDCAAIRRRLEAYEPVYLQNVYALLDYIAVKEEENDRLHKALVSARQCLAEHALDTEHWGVNDDLTLSRIDTALTPSGHAIATNDWDGSEAAKRWGAYDPDQEVEFD